MVTVNNLSIYYARKELVAQFKKNMQVIKTVIANEDKKGKRAVRLNLSRIASKIESFRVTGLMNAAQWTKEDIFDQIEDSLILQGYTTHRDENTLFVSWA